MIAISNYIARLIHDITLSSQDQQQVGSLKNFAQTRANELIMFSRQAAAKAAEHGAEIIVDRDTVMTCSYSSTVCQTFETAKMKGVQFNVIIAESQYKGKFYGKISAEQISQHRIPVTIVYDNDIHHQVAEATKAFVGADTILSDGSVINGIPTYKLARAASRANIPFYSVCETVKFDIRNRQDKQPGPEPGFVKTPPDMITGIITEAGIMKPDQVKLYASDITIPGPG
jgi:translation initiation factor 2B subunit (eIF-2B alpha/beta/delta family)